MSFIIIIIDKNFERLQQVASELKRKLGEQYKIETINKIINNGSSLTGISICRVETMIGQVFYLEDYFTEYNNGNLKISDIVKDIIEVMSKTKVPDVGGLQEILNNYSVAREKVRVRLINYEANKEKLNDMPHRKYLDLAAVFYVELGELSDGIMTGQITNRILNNWEVSESDLYQKALSNTLLYEPVCISDINLLMNELTEDMPSELKDFLQEMIIMPKPKLYIATNPSRSYGASALLNLLVLDKFANAQNSDLVIYPASTDEILIQPVSEIDEEMLISVKEINNESVEKEKQLSNSIYLFERAKHAVRILKKGDPLEK